MTAKELFDKVYKKAIDFGMVAKNERDKIIDTKGNTIVRENLFPISFVDGTAFFGFSSPDVEKSIRQLRENGIIKREGGRKIGYWIIK